MTDVAEFQKQDETAIERLVRDPTVTPEKVQQYMDLQDRAMKRDAEAAYNTAMVAMQASLPVIRQRGTVKDRSGNVQSRYALWEDINVAVLPVLREHGFSLTFRQEQTATGMCITGVLAHRQGHSERTSITLPADTSGSKNAVQAVASSCSYGKRITAGLLLNLTSTGDDDDGRSAGAVPRMTQAHADEIESRCSEVSQVMLAKVLRSYNVARLEDIPDAEYPSIMDRLARKG